MNKVLNYFQKILTYDMSSKRIKSEHYSHPFVLHPAGTSPNSAFFEEIRNFCLDFTMVVYEKIYFKAYINSQYI